MQSFPLRLAFLAKKLDPLEIYIIGLVLGFASLVLLPSTSNLYQIIGLMIISGIDMAFLWPPVEAMVAYIARKRS